MARLLQTDGTEVEIGPRNARDGFTLQEVYTLLSCDMVQAVPIEGGKLLILDEERKLKESPQFINEAATELLRQAGGIPGDFVVGDALVCSRREFQ